MPQARGIHQEQGFGPNQARADRHYLSCTTPDSEWGPSGIVRKSSQGSYKSGEGGVLESA